MGISITVYTVSDAELRLLQNDLISLNTVLSSVTAKTTDAHGYLNGYWRALNAILTEDEVTIRLPEAALTVGDIALPHIESGAHGIFAETNARLAELLASMSEERVRLYVKARESEFAGPRAVAAGQGLSEVAARQLTADRCERNEKG